MGEVIQFQPRLRLVRPISAEQVEIDDTVRETMAEGLCPHCYGRGVRIRLINPRAFFPSDYESLPCPCGGDDENRIDTGEPDFPGAA